MPNMRLVLIALVAVVSMSMVPVLIKSTAANEVTIGIARLLIAVVIFTPAVYWRGHLSTLSRQQWLQLLLIGFVFAVHWLTYFVSIKLATASIAALAITTYGVQYLALAHVFNNEKISPIEWSGVVCCLGGCVLVSPELAMGDSTTQGIAIGLFSALLYASLPLMHRRAQLIPTIDRTWGQFFFALLFFLPLVSYSDWQLQATDWYKLLVLGVVCTVIAHGLWVKVSTELPAIYTSMIYYLYLPLTVVSSIYFLEESLTIKKLIGIGVVLTVSTAITLNRYRQREM